MIRILPLIFTTLSITTTYAKTCKNDEVLDQSHNKIALAEIADHVGFCSHHASRDLLHQAICKAAKDPKDCFQPSVTEFLAIDGGQESSKSKNSSAALEEIIFSSRVSSSECLEFDSLFNTKSSKEYKTYDEKFASVTEDMIIKECERQKKLECDPSSTQANLTSALLKLSKECKLIVNSPDRDKYLYSSILGYKKTKSCTEREIPNFKLKTQTYNSENSAEAEIALKRILKAGNQVSLKIKGPHALVVSNYRVICHKGKEKLQYQTLDSLYNTIWSASKKAGDWIDSEEITKKLDPLGKFGWLVPQPFERGFSISKRNGDNMIQKVSENANKAGLRKNMKVLHHEINEERAIAKIKVVGDDDIPRTITYSVANPGSDPGKEIELESLPIKLNIGDTGAFVFDLKPGSPAYEAGLRNDMNFRNATINTKTNIITIWIKNGNNKVQSFSLEKLKN